MHRRGRAGLFLEHFDVNGCKNVVLGGDLSWDDDVDGPLPLGNGWVDAWAELRGGEGPGGWTYDAVANPMLSGYKPERKRPDRFVCKLRDFVLENIEMVGVEPIHGVTHCNDMGQELPVLPSHHFGLLLTITSPDAE
jgi:tyrosyl-DNA phosphodiesterase 2